MSYAELCVTSNFTFLTGASHAEELIARAKELGLAAIAITDRNTFAGIVRGHAAAKELGLRYIVGVRLVLADGPDLLAYPKSRTGYGNLCRLLTLGKRRTEKGKCDLRLDDVVEWGADCVFIVMGGDEDDPHHHHDGGDPPVAAADGGGDDAAVGDHDDDGPGRNDAHDDGNNVAAAVHRLIAAFDGDVFIGIAPRYDGADDTHFAARAQLSETTGAPPVALGDVIMHAGKRRMLADILSCIREKTTIDKLGRRALPNAERRLKSEFEIRRLFRDYPAAVQNAGLIAERCAFSLDELKYEYPDEIADGMAPNDRLRLLTEEGLKRRYPDGETPAVRALVEKELALIAELDYARYFLTVHDVVAFARSKNILCQGRGSAANSVVCYALSVTEASPETISMVFERFISAARNEPPDIDVDFEHERREEVIQHIYEKYGRHRAGICSTVIHFRSRAAIREVGKAMGLSEDAVAALASQVWGTSSSGIANERAKAAGLDLADRRLQQTLALTKEIIGFPRHLSQHVGGFVITRDRLDEVVPLMNTAMVDRTMVEWDKDDLDALGILKIDILALGMLTCLARGLELLASHYDAPLTLATIPKEKSYVYAMIQRADTIGVFQIESRAQMSMLPRLRPKDFYDLVIEVAIVRPGPIQGDMVHPYLRRREGKEPVTYPKEELRAVLGKTLGVPLFQEQAMKIAIVAAGFTPSEADRLRRAMATFRRVGTIHTFQRKMIEGMVANGYEKQFAERCFQQIEGFGEYGFPESHAASFALLVYASSWMKAVYPDVFCAAILNAQPMGFYAPGQLIRDAREHGVEIRPVDVNLSDWDCTLEEATFDPAAIAPRHAGMRDIIKSRHAVRLGFRQVKGLSEADMERLVEMRGAGYDSVRDLWLRAGLARATVERLADADAFSSLGLSRREALWAARALDPAAASEHLPLFESAADPSPEIEAEMRLPTMPPGEEVINDYRYLSFSLKAHPVSFLRERFSHQGIVQNQRLETMRTGQRTTVAGLVLVRQRPGSAKGVIFMTIEDETGVANVIVWPKAFETFRREVLGSRLIRVEGRLQNESGVIHLVADRIADISGELAWLDADHDPKSADIESLARGDEVRRPVMENRVFRKSGAQAARKLKAANPPPAAPLQELPLPLSEPAREAARVMPKGRNFH